MCQFLDKYFPFSHYNIIMCLFAGYFMLKIDLRPYFLFLVFFFYYYFRLSLRFTWLHDGLIHGPNRQKETVKRGKISEKMKFGQRKVSEKSWNLISD